MPAAEQLRRRRLLLGWRRSLLIVVFVAITELGAMVGIRADWLGVWTQTTSVFGQSLVLSFPAAIALSVWFFGQIRQSTMGLFEDTSPRPRWAHEFHQLGEFTLAAGMGLLLAGLVVGIATGSVATHGGPDLLTFLAVVGWLAMAGAVGIRCAGFGRFVIVAPIAAVIGYASLIWVITRASGTAELLAPLDWRWMTLYSKADWVSFLQYFVAVAASVLILGLRRGGRPLRWVSITILVPCCVTLLTWGPGPSRQVDIGAARLQCAEEIQRTMCLPAVKDYLRAQIAAAWVPLDREAPGLLPKNVVYVNDEAKGINPQTDAELAATLDRFRGRPVILASALMDLSAVTWISTAEFQARSVDLLIPPAADGYPEASEADGFRLRATPDLALRAWVYDQLGLPADGSAYIEAEPIDSSAVNYAGSTQQLQRLDSLSIEQLQTWFTTHREAIATGTLTWSDFATP